MQTFLPYASFVESARCLDRQRLGKQRIEVLQILRALTGETKGWVNHPVVKAWHGYQMTLAAYGVKCCEEWIGRGYKDTTRDKILDLVGGEIPNSLYPPPWYTGYDDRLSPIHSAYRALLLHKDPDHYSQFGWSEDPIEKFPWELLSRLPSHLRRPSTSDVT